MVKTTKNNIETTYTYGPDGLRRSMTRGGVTTYYILDGQNVVQEWKDTDDDNTIDANELVTYFNGRARFDATGENPEERWYLFDGLGSVLGEVDEDGNVTSTQRLDVYGLPLSSAGTAKSDHKFVGSLGHTTDSETGLTYMRARYYDPAIGRFISEDPAGNGMNWFAYCANNPVNAVDPTGKFEIPYMADFVIGGILILLGQWMIRNTERATLAYILGIGGTLIGGLGAFLAIKSGVEFLGPILVDTMDRVTDAINGFLDSSSQEKATSLTERITSVIYGYEIMVLGYTEEVDL